MNAFATISTIMTSQLWTVNPEDNLLVARDLFNAHHIHHIPVVRFRQIVGLLSKSDFDCYVAGMKGVHEGAGFETKLGHVKVEDLMTRRLAKLESDDRINVALEVFSLNRFHALPVVDKDELVGIVTPFDVMKAMLNEKPAHPEDVYADLPEGKK